MIDHETQTCSSFTAIERPTLPPQAKTFSISVMKILIITVISIIAVSIAIQSWIPVVVMMCIPLVVSMFACVMVTLVRKEGKDRIIIIGQPPEWCGYNFNEDEKVDPKHLN